MWIVRLALRRPYTFIVAALVVLLMGVLSVRSMSTDIFPTIDIPVVTVVWRYSGLTPDDMAKRITTYSEYTISSVVDSFMSLSGLDPGSSSQSSSAPKPHNLWMLRCIFAM